MKHILVLGAGMSSPCLIHHLLEEGARKGWTVTVADLDQRAAEKRVGGHAAGRALAFDVRDLPGRRRMIEQADVVVNLLTPLFQPELAAECVETGTHFVSASYSSPEVRALDREARDKGLLVLTECGLDPGIDHMSAMQMIRRIQGEGGVIRSFWSYGSGVPAPETPANPLKYVITWNPRNVVLAGQKGAQYLEKGRQKIVPGLRMFENTWPVDVPGVGGMEAYPNRDSLLYPELLGLKDLHTMVRATLRHKGFAAVWHQIVRLGLNSEHVSIPGLSGLTFAEVTRMFLPRSMDGCELEQGVANLLGISPTGVQMDTLRWLGLFSDELVGGSGESPADMMVGLLQRKLALEGQTRDMVILQHEMDVEQDGRTHTERATLVVKGDPGGFTAMSRTVGLPAALSVCLLLDGKLEERGALLPITAAIYDPVMAALAEQGIVFQHDRLGA